MLLYEVEYSGILQVRRHYTPLKKDFSNIRELLALLEDRANLQEIATRTFAEIALNPSYSYAKVIEWFDDVVEQDFLVHNKTHVSEPYSRNSFYLTVVLSVPFFVRKVLSMIFQRILLGAKLRRVAFKLRTKIRPISGDAIPPLRKIIGR